MSKSLWTSTFLLESRGVWCLCSSGNDLHWMLKHCCEEDLIVFDPVRLKASVRPGTDVGWLVLPLQLILKVFDGTPTFQRTPEPNLIGLGDLGVMCSHLHQSILYTWSMEVLQTEQTDRHVWTLPDHHGFTYSTVSVWMRCTWCYKPQGLKFTRVIYHTQPSVCAMSVVKVLYGWTLP